jgi:alpha-tubulin suppressor-like RCC1 family protein
VQAGQAHACARRADGSVWCWGDNTYGQLGTGDTVSSRIATRSAMTAAQQVSGGFDHTCAISGGTVKCWGENGVGELGDGTTVDHYLPGPVTGLANVRSVTAGVGFTCSVLAGGGMRCWGSNAFGGLGTGTTVGSLVPVPVVS